MPVSTCLEDHTWTLGDPCKSPSLSFHSSSDSPCLLPGQSGQTCSPKARFGPLGFQGIYPFNTRGLDLLSQHGDPPDSQFTAVKLWTGGTHHSHSLAPPPTSQVKQPGEVGPTLCHREPYPRRKHTVMPGVDTFIGGRVHHSGKLRGMGKEMGYASLLPTPRENPITELWGGSS